LKDEIFQKITSNWNKNQTLKDFVKEHLPMYSMPWCSVILIGLQILLLKGTGLQIPFS
jgi:hypothetical protein